MSFRYKNLSALKKYVDSLLNFEPCFNPKSYAQRYIRVFGTDLLAFLFFLSLSRWASLTASSYYWSPRFQLAFYEAGSSSSRQYLGVLFVASSDRTALAHSRSLVSGLVLYGGFV